jgi:tetratricopeptide (TPR) repeat protein
MKRTSSMRVTHLYRIGTGLALVLLIAGCGGGSKQVAPEIQTDRGPIDVRDREAWQQELDLARSQTVLAPQEAFWPYHRGTLHAAVGATEDAEAALREALLVDRGFEPALSLLSKILFEEARHEEAISILETARAESVPNTLSPELIEGLALHYDALGDLKAADVLLQEVESQVPESESVPSFVLLRGEDYLSATGPARQAVEANSQSAVNQNNFGITCLHSGDPIQAREVFHKAVELDPMLPGPLYNLALIEKFYFMNDERAAMWWSRYRAISSEDPDNLRETFEGPIEDVSSTEEGTEP